MRNRLTNYRPALRRTTALALGFTIGLSAAASAGAAVWSVRSAGLAGAAGSATAVQSVRCVSALRVNAPLARRIASGIDHALSGRISTVGLDVTDNKSRITCWYHSSWHFISASVVKVIILAALLRKLRDEHRALSAQQRALTSLMITQSDNHAASVLWAQVGRPSLQRFLRLAGMRQTVLGPSGYWGLTEITAGNEVQLLTLITAPNKVLSQPARIYARYLMSRVIASQRWGVPAGAPASVKVCVKNGWLPYPSGSDWRINSIGAFSTPKRIYLMAILTAGNPSMAYGIGTIEGAAGVVHRALNPGRHKTIPPTTPGPSWGQPDEPIPPLGKIGWLTPGTLTLASR